MEVITFDKVWKKFKRGEKFNSLRDTIPNLFRKANGLERAEFWALKDVSFGVQQGDVLGIIGPNGAGKSTILKLLSGILKPNKGSFSINGRLAALIEVGAGFHNELTGRENIYLNGTILGMNRKEIDSKFDSIVEFSGLEEFIDTPVKRYSSGMYSRLGFSVAVHMDPDILLVDEVLAVGDMAFQAKSAQKMRELLNSGATIVLISHNLPLIQNLCKRVILLNKGEIHKEGTAEEIIPHYQNIVYRKREEELKKAVGKNENKVKIKQETLVEITDVFLHDGSHQQKEAFGFGEPISVKINYDAKQGIDNPVFSLDIIRSDNVICCSSNTKDDEYFIPNISGKGGIEIDLGNLNLISGFYVIKTSILDKDMVHSYDVKRDFLRISDKNLKFTRKGIFSPKIEWKINKT